MNSSNAYLLSLEPIKKFIALTLDQYAIPSNAKRLALNFKCSQFYINKRGIQPVEIQIERTDENAGWEIRFVATFDYPTLNSESLDVSLYFNFHFGWFYHPDIKRCELDRPEVTGLFHSWLIAFLQHVRQNSFDIQVLTLVKAF